MKKIYLLVAECFWKHKDILFLFCLKEKKTVNGRWPLSFAGDGKHKNILDVVYLVAILTQKTQERESH